MKSGFSSFSRSGASSHDGLFLHLGAVGLDSKDGIDELRLTTQTLKGVLAGLLLTLFLGETCAFLALQTLNKHLNGEYGTAILVARLFQIAKLHLDTILLTPFEQLRLEVDLLIGHLVDIDELCQDAFFHKAHASAISAVQIDGSHQRLEGVAIHIAVMGIGVTCREDELVESHLLGELSQGLTTDELGTGIGEESLALALEVAIDDVANDSIEHSIAQELQTFVVLWTAFLVAASHTLVQQRLLIEADVMRIEAENTVESRKKLLLLAERELYLINYIYIVHSS